VTPSKEAKSIYIFCEGIVREFQYFEYFREMDSRIKIEVIKPEPHGNTTPKGIFTMAEKYFHKKTMAKGKNSYTLMKGDEVWIVFDTDKDKLETRKPQIEEIRKQCQQKTGWFPAESNPCFEIWLYYHRYKEKPDEQEVLKFSRFKEYLNSKIRGGFNYKYHTIFIKTAIENSKANYSETNEGTPAQWSTQVFRLADSMYSILGSKIEDVLKSIS